MLKTNAFETIRIQDEDFFNGSEHLRIEVLVDEMNKGEASIFSECKTPVKGSGYRQMKLILDVTQKNGRMSNSEVCAETDAQGHSLSPAMKASLHATYLKPLRDAENELTAKKYSRLSRILLGHELLQEKDENNNPHKFISVFEKANAEIEEWFENDDYGDKSPKKQIKDVIDGFLKMFIDESYASKFFLANPTMRNILERISISILESNNLGLGTLNRLFMATELLLLKKAGNHLRICLIEELEAHIHPQAQMKVVSGLQKEKEVQFILTTHSPNITSKIKLGGDSKHNILICKGDKVFPMGPEYTRLEKKDYKYLDHFLDVTKSNLFFAKGVILVEGWAEEILLPVIAAKMGIDLTQKEISIVNVGSTAYLHFARIFMRQDNVEMDVKCAVVTDLDVMPDDEEWKVKKKEKLDSINRKLGDLPDNVRTFVAEEWTLEWCLYKSDTLSALFKEAVRMVHNRTEEFKVDQDNAFDKESFEKKLKEKLRNQSLDKVAIAQELADKIRENEIIFSDQDESINYLIKAIRFVAE